MNRFVLGSEVMAFADAFNKAYGMKYASQFMTNTYIPLQMMTDSLFLFDILKAYPPQLKTV